MKQFTFMALAALAIVLSTTVVSAGETGGQKSTIEKRAESSAMLYSNIEPAAGDPARVMALTRSQVRSLQDRLIKHGYKPGSVDGILGPKTSNAIRAFQKENKLPITGSASNETLMQLGFQTKKEQKPLYEMDEGM